MNALDQIFDWLMSAFGVAQSVTNFRIQSSHVGAFSNSGGHDCQRVPQRIARPTQRWAHPSVFGDWESADFGAGGGGCMACAAGVTRLHPPQISGSLRPHRLSDQYGRDLFQGQCGREPTCQSQRWSQNDK